MRAAPATDIDPQLAAAAALHDRGDLPGALRGFCKAVASAPDNLAAIGSVGLLLIETGGSAAAWFERVIAHAPQSVPAYHNLALALRYRDGPRSIRCFRRAGALDPTLAEAHRELGRLDVEALAYASAGRRLNRSLALSPRVGATLMAAAELARRRFDAALAWRHMRRATALEPASVAMLNSAGLHLVEFGSVPEGIGLYRRGLAVAWHYPELWGNMGSAALRARRAGEAASHLRRSLALAPASVRAISALAVAVSKQSEDKTRSFCRRAVAIDRDAAAPRVVLATTYLNQGFLSQAASQCRQALALDPGHSDCLMALGAASQDLRLLDRALESYGRALAVNPHSINAQRNIVYALMHLPNVPEDRLFRMARTFAARNRPTGRGPDAPWANEPTTDRPLRIGYVSSDFRDHPNRWFMHGLFEHGDRRGFAVICYTSDHRSDAETRWIRDRVEGWRDIANLTDAEAASAMREDRIDIAVFIGGRFDGNRPFVAAHRAAPVQVSYLDGGTSGVPEMDYWITDAMLHPQGGTTERFSEALYRLPCFYSFARPMPPLPVSALPARSQGGISFGSLAQPARATDEVIATWADILSATPGSRLILKSRNRYGDPANVERILQSFATRGIAGERITIQSGVDEKVQHLRRYEAIDIALDTFPFSGATTNFEALWMGVPVVTLSGTRFVGRMATAILTTAGLGELVASTREDYVGKAVRLAQDWSCLETLRRTLRVRLEASKLCDGKSYASDMEAAYRDMWQRWCAGGRG